MLFQILLFLSFMIISPESGANTCVQNSLKKLAKGASYSRSVTYLEFLKAEAQFKKVENRPHYIGHLRGEFFFSQAAKEVKLNSGLHTHEALEFFKRMRPDLADDISIAIMPNGVGVAYIPEDAFEPWRLRKLGTKKKTVDGREIIYAKKSIFPKSWTEDDIVAAVEAIKNNKASLIEVKDGATFIIGHYKDVKVRIIIREDEIRTVFPLAK
jgi:Bacterial EndoU nuclease